MRVKQFWAAITARVTQEDATWVNQHLSEEEARLFFRMNLPDQQHTIRVARTAMELAKAQTGAVDCTLLLKAGLLHDVGKIKGDVSTMDKVLTVLGHKFAPHMMRSWGREGRGTKIDNLRHACYVYFHHPQRGADFLRQIGEKEDLIELVAHHHDHEQAEDTLMLRLLRRADELH